MKPAALAFSLAVIAGASGCASGPAAYAPAAGAGPGYAEAQLGQARYRVVFRGNSRTPDAAVKQMLFYRAAELALRDGYDAFRVISQAARVAGGREARGASSFEPTVSRAYEHNLFGYITSMEWSVSPPLTEAQHYEAEVEIALLRGPVGPEGRLFDAREVLGVLADKVSPLAPGRAR